ncbi:HDR051Cp [Eremothecium sinecaudum]|uniref:Vacuolar protein sorting-associated protein 28 n=1 Tax=Eremothecium sinecaudum TaxID=45286 RepID=A0A109UZT0_9SACH|nr:HDR051Cp [Eremothecium sinecaudum]AMD20793.1 HDR051Cp [Eremothecium sinecaudum]
MDSKIPSSHQGFSNHTNTSNPKLLEEIPLFGSETTPQQREVTETLAEIYSVIIALDQVEKSYLKDGISNTEYTNAVSKLLAQYKTYLTNNKDVEEEFVSLDKFKEKWNISASNAITRIERGIPVTVEHAIRDISSEDINATNSGASKFSAKAVAEVTGNFITAMDALKLNYKAKDQLHPLMSELLLSINRVTSQDFENRAKLVNWIVSINKMKVDELLSEEESRELLFDLESAYKSFYLLLG